MYKGSVIVGLSGGVDSSVAALLLKRAGWRVEALFMKNWEEDDTQGYCAAAHDLADAQSVADKLDIPLRTINFSAEYWDSVFTHFLKEYQAGRTPNPDVLCNKEIKFKAFLDYALEQGADFIATGHYAKVAHGSPHRLLCAADANKDQTYFLYLLNQHALAHSLFPLGDLNKTEVRRIAARAGLKTAQKKDSTGICFIGERRFRDFLSQYLPANPGPITTPDGKEIGQHQGLMYYTLGQRQGLGIGGVKGAREAPWFVARKDVANNRLIVVQGANHPLLFSDTLIAKQLHWIAGSPPATHFSCQARCRHRQALQTCKVWIEDDIMKVHFQTPQRAITPGQSIVLYQGHACLGGGIIQ